MKIIWILKISSMNPEKTEERYLPFRFQQNHLRVILLAPGFFHRAKGNTPSVIRWSPVYIKCVIFQIAWPDQTTVSIDSCQSNCSLHFQENWPFTNVFSYKYLRYMVYLYNNCSSHLTQRINVKRISVKMYFQYIMCRVYFILHVAFRRRWVC